MKTAEAIKLLTLGYLGFIAEYRSGKTAEIPYVSKKTGKSMTMKKAQHTLEVNGESVVMGEILKDDVDLSKWQAPAAKGQKCLVALKSMSNDLGSLKASGTVQLLVD